VRGNGRKRHPLEFLPFRDYVDTDTMGPMLTFGSEEICGDGNDP